jgi:hypothetical protein
MAKLHELLAVEPDLKGASEKILNETVTTFSKKEGHFKAQVRKYEPVDDEGIRLPDERTEMVTTVADKLEWTWEKFGKYLDAVAQKESTNVEASATVEIDGKPLIDRPLPATLLLALESRLRQLRDVYNAIPTLEPGEKWEWDSQTRSYATDGKTTFRTQKVRKNHVLAQATEKHPAQVDVYTEDVVIGRWNTKKWSGALTPAEKADLLDRVDAVTQAIKRARQRANMANVNKVEISKTLYRYIHEPIKRE